MKRYIRIASVRKLSSTSTSFEKRLTILPSGVVSKKDLQIGRLVMLEEDFESRENTHIGAPSTLCIARANIFLLASVPPSVKTIANTNVSSP